ncbi:DHS-like NAD/FAD-binding domain-containing protein [Kalaharituber pfeilii]|nr:DHS-like NAD/FAD-binding domain-containing protein [Kalaharituber pfeilii]
MEPENFTDRMEAPIILEPPLKKQKTEQDHVTAEVVVLRPPPVRKAPETIDLRACLSGPALTKAQQRSIDTLLKVFRKKKKIVVVAGAGISVGAGIPDFRSAGGLFSTLRSDHKLKTSGKELFDAAVYRDNELTSSFHDMVRNLDSMVKKATPTAFHHLLASLAHEDRLLRLYSQNVDCIENQLPPLRTKVPLEPKGPWPKTIQLHGGLEKMVCSKCGWLGGFNAELFRGSEPPNCLECVEMESVRGIAGKRSLGVGKLRPRIVLYNEYHPDSEAIGCVSRADLKTRPDALVVVGTSLKVPGIKRIVREMCKSVQDIRGGVTVWINEDDPPLGKDLEGAFDLIVKGDCEKVAGLVALPRWDGTVSEVRVESSTPEFREVSKFPTPANELEIQVPPTPATANCLGKKRKSPGESKPRVPKKNKEGEPKKPRAPRKPRIPAQPKVTLDKTFKAAKQALPSAIVGKAQKPQQGQDKVQPQNMPTPPMSSPPPLPPPEPTIHVRQQVLA